MTLRKFMAVSMETIETTAVIMLIVAGASIFAWILTANQVTEKFAAGLLSISTNKYVVLMLINIILFIVGFFMETIAAITILTPVLLPAVVQLGVDPIHFGVIMVLNLMIGLLTPPVGMVLYVLPGWPRFPLSVAQKRRYLSYSTGYSTAMVTFIEPISMWLPRLIFSR